MNYKQFEQNLILWEPFIVMSLRTFAEPTHLASVNARETVPGFSEAGSPHDEKPTSQALSEIEGGD
jgi:hypothetical protein